ncbi:LLM class flavin-dependent oxidoreductase [Amycolatopsis sp. GM8]|uniref:LLM class flavin-dependent oxidoreductase n=1 Tax=Amycolatopsis sp. GM8 TaxID=2896530 RepID=UPI001F186466|nr:LLM class flavin-dependent oxidoreductase [Amycolatopsis sp. GM8]
MELGLFVQNYVPATRWRGVPDAEHRVIEQDIEVAVTADRYGWKYLWASEHHFLEEYSHLSANDVFLAFVAARTSRIHLGSGIFNPLPQVNHPAKVAETVAYLDQISGGRAEFGTGRGAGSHEILGFLDHAEITETSTTKEIWEDVIGEFAKMFTHDVYPGYRGKYWSLPERHILPKPYGGSHPPMWYAAGNPSSYEMAARKGLGVLGFSVSAIAELEPVLAAYKGAIGQAEPVGAFVNDNVLVTIPMFVAEDAAEARRKALRGGLGYLNSLVFRYHDTFPRPAGVPQWPALLPDPDADGLEESIRSGRIICGDPDEALEQIRRWESAGVDQLCYASPPTTHEDSLDTIRLVGEYVIPKIDGAAEHRTAAFRRTAA